MLATVEQLRIRLGYASFTAAQTARATQLLEGASGQFITAARHNPIAEATTTDVLRAPSGAVLRLPLWPVTAVTAVTLDDVALTVDSGYEVRASGRLWRGSGWGGDDVDVSVTYTHGFATIPDDVIDVVTAVAARAWVNPAGLSREQHDQYAATHGLPSGLTEHERAIASAYRPRM